MSCRHNIWFPDRRDMDRDTKTTDVIKETEKTAERQKKEGANTLETVTKGMTRIYDVTDKETRIVPRHRWIGEDGQDANDLTRIMDLSAARMPEEEVRPGDEPKSARERISGAAKSVSGAAKGAAGAAKGAASAVSGAARDVRNVKVADSARFGRFLKIVGVFAVILLLELGWLWFSGHVRGMPDQIAKTQKELDLTKKENALLDEELNALKEAGKTEEQKQSWENLRDRVREATGQTSS